MRLSGGRLSHAVEVRICDQIVDIVGVFDRLDLLFDEVQLICVLRVLNYLGEILFEVLVNETGVEGVDSSCNIRFSLVNISHF